jgi:hypothetical protein
MQTRRIALIALAVMVFAAGPRAGDDGRAARVLAQARAAMGGEAKLASVRGLTASGAVTKQMPGEVQAGELQFDLQLPDKLLRTDSVRPPVGDGVFIMLRGINGETLLRNSKILNAGPGARMSRPPLAGGSEAQAIVHARADLARFALAFLLTAPVGMPLEFADAGVAESPDGTADVLSATAANGVAVRLFIDRKTHRLLMMTYRGVDPRFPSASRVAPSSQAAPAASNRQTSADTQEIVDITLFLDDFRAVDGLMLPHHAALAVDGEVDENWSFKRMRINPVFGPGAFSDK